MFATKSANSTGENNAPWGKKMKGGILNAVTIMVLLSAVLVAAAPMGQVWNFDRDQHDAVTRDFSDEVGQWEVVKDATAPSKDHVLAQLAKNSSSTT